MRILSLDLLLIHLFTLESSRTRGESAFRSLFTGRGSIRTPQNLKAFEKRRNPAMFRPGPLIGARDLLRFLRKPPEASGDGAQ